jgi:cell division protease FtsH
LKVHSKSKKLDPGVDLRELARGTPGFSGADLANLVNEAAIAAARADRDVISASDFDQARDRVILGRREGSNVLLPDEKHAVAVHEAGHALVAALSATADPVAKVTILPAGQALGVTEQLPLDDRHLYGEDYLHDSLAVRLGGRAAELVELGQGSTGASNDLAGATDLAVRMVREFGLSKEIGPIGYPQGGSVYLGGDGPGLSSRPYAEQTQARIDAEVQALLVQAEQRAVELLTNNRSKLRQLVDLLMAQETVNGSQVYAIAGVAEPSRMGPGTTVAPKRAAVTAATVEDGSPAPVATGAP